jgi:hypothetical protein
MGMDWDEATTVAVLEEWTRWGLARHSYFLRASDVAAAVRTVVSAPRGVHLTLVEVQPEAPLTGGRHGDDADRGRLGSVPGPRDV